MVSGMSLDLTDVPHQKHLPRDIQFNTQELQAAEEHISQLLNKKAITHCTFDPSTDFLSNVFLTPKKDGGYRMILNFEEI